MNDSKEDGGIEIGNQEDGTVDDNFDLDLLDFSKSKKKKKKKKDLDELMAEAEEKAEDKENGIFFINSSIFNVQATFKG